MITAKNGLVAGLEEVSAAIMLQIVRKRVAGEYSLHQARERNVSYFNSEMEVIAHQAIRQQLRARLLFDSLENEQESFAISVVRKYCTSVDAAGHHMIDRAGIMYSRQSSHTYLTVCPPKWFPCVE